MAVKKNMKDVVDELISMKYPIDVEKNNGVTALGIASYRGNIPLMQKLIDHGANVELTNK